MAVGPGMLERFGRPALDLPPWGGEAGRPVRALSCSRWSGGDAGGGDQAHGAKRQRCERQQWIRPAAGRLAVRAGAERTAGRAPSGVRLVPDVGCELGFGGLRGQRADGQREARNDEEHPPEQQTQEAAWWLVDRVGHDASLEASPGRVAPSSTHRTPGG
jgi:hypothetical protein